MKNEELQQFLDNTKDEPRNLEKCVDFFYLLQRTQGSLLEVVTLLKFEKPLLHSLLKIRIKHNPGLSMLFNLSMDYDEAKKKIGIL